MSTVFNSTVRLVGISYRAKKWICFKVGNYEKNSYGSRARLCSRALRRWLGAVASRHAIVGGSDGVYDGDIPNGTYPICYQNWIHMANEA